MTDLPKRSISFAVFGAGICAGLWGCSILPKSVFVIGVNDSAPSIWALILTGGTTLPVCILALWKRRPAGIWLTMLGLFFPVAMLYQRHYMLVVRHFRNEESVGTILLEFADVYVTLLVLGLFTLITERLKWPQLLGKK